MTNYFELYGIPPSFYPDAAVIKGKYYDLSRRYHPDRFASTGGSELAEALQMSALNNQAYKTLRDPDATMAYILKQHALLEDEEKYALPPAFLMEMMDLNEAISEAETAPGNTHAAKMATNSLNGQLEMWQDATTLLTQRYEAGEKDKELLLAIKDQYFRKKYLLRIKERIDRFAASSTY